MMLYPWTWIDVALWYAGLWFFGCFLLWGSMMGLSLLCQLFSFHPKPRI